MGIKDFMITEYEAIELEEDLDSEPVLIIHRINSKGLVDVKFSEELISVSNLTLINSTVLFLQVVPGDESRNASIINNFTWSVE